MLTVAVASALALSPTPRGLPPEAWTLLAIFVATIFAIVTHALPIAPAAIAALVATAWSQVLAPGDPPLALRRALSGFGEPVVWLIVVAFVVARGLLTSGLGRRIAYLFVRRGGKRAIGLSYGLILADALVAPVVPSNTARGGGLIYPIARSIAEALHSRPDDGTERKVGSFLLFSAFHGNVLTSALFLTSMAANPVAANLAESQGVTISFGLWALAAIVPTLISLLVVPQYLYRFYAPEQRHTPEASKWAAAELKKLGPLQRAEWSMLLVFVVLFVLWSAGKLLGIETTTAAFFGLLALILLRVLRWSDIEGEKAAWGTLIWFSVLLMLARQIDALGVTAWIGALAQPAFEGMSWPLALALLVGGYCYVHYLFASQTAHVVALFGVFLKIGFSAGVPAKLMALSLAFASNYNACITIYGTSVAPVYFQSGYISSGDWHKHGAVILLLHLLIYLGFGTAWMRIVGVF